MQSIISYLSSQGYQSASDWLAANQFLIQDVTNVQPIWHSANCHIIQLWFINGAGVHTYHTFMHGL